MEEYRPNPVPGGTIPAHDAAGRMHLGLAIPADQLQAWESHLAAHNVPIESRVQGARGGTSLYFRDPDGHLLELLTPGIWDIY